MGKDIHWINGPIPGRLAIMGRPRPGEWLEDEIAGWKKDGIQFVVSLLETPESEKLNVANEAYLCQKYTITFISHPFPDRGVPPSVDDTAALVQTLKFHLQNQKKIIIHCHNGIGRSAVVAACVLQSFGIAPKRAFELIAAARGFMVPDTNQQREWVVEFAAACENAAAKSS